MMRAMVLRHAKPVEDGPLVWSAVPNPEPGRGEILIRVSICGVCRTDLHQVEGELPMQRSPVIPGHQIVGSVVDVGADARRFKAGDRVGVGWLHQTCGRCEFCAKSSENLCSSARFTGWSVDGGYAEYATIPDAFAYQIPDGFSDEQAAPLLCAGIIGYRALRLSGIQPGQRLGLYGFGASAHIAIQVAGYWGCEVYVVTRSEANRELARKLVAAWVGGAKETPPAKVHGSVVFAPAGPVVLDALDALEKGGTVSLAGIHMSPIPPMDYRRHLYNEKCVRSVANATRRDGEQLLTVAAEIPIRTATAIYSLEQANDALLALKTGRTHGAALLRC